MEFIFDAGAIERNFPAHNESVCVRTKEGEMVQRRGFAYRDPSVPRIGRAAMVMTGYG